MIWLGISAIITALTIGNTNGFASTSCVSCRRVQSVLKMSVDDDAVIMNRYSR
jgi:hypothetical protein